MDNNSNEKKALDSSELSEKDLTAISGGGSTAGTLMRGPDGQGFAVSPLITADGRPEIISVDKQFYDKAEQILDASTNINKTASVSFDVQGGNATDLKPF